MKKMPLELSIYLSYFKQDKGITGSELCRWYRSYPPRTISFHEDLKIGQKAEDRRKYNKSRRQVVKKIDKQRIFNTIPKLRKNYIHLPRKELEAGTDQSMSDLTVRRCLNKQNFGFFQLRKKGMLFMEYLKSLEKFAKTVIKVLSDYFWKNEISFYLDGMSFAHK